MKRILSIDASVTFQLIVRRVLGEAYELTIAPSPRAANVLLGAHRYDLMITDFLFPQGDGLDVIVPLRQQKSAKDLPLIAVSSSMDATLVTRLLKAGVNACVAKPIKPEEFRALVDRMLREPFVESYQNHVSTVSSFQWFEHGTYHEFCPEISAHLTGPDRAEVARRIQTLLHESAAKGVPLGFTSQERVQSHTVRHDTPTPPEIEFHPGI